MVDLIFAGLECCHEFYAHDATVQVTFIVGVGFDGDRLLSNLVGEGLEAAERRLTLDLVQARLVLLDHPLVMVGGNDSQALR